MAHRQRWSSEKRSVSNGLVASVDVTSVNRGDPSMECKHAVLWQQRCTVHAGFWEVRGFLHSMCSDSQGVLLQCHIPKWSFAFKTQSMQTVAREPVYLAYPTR